MKKEIVTFWSFLNDHIQKNYPDKVCFLYDKDHWVFDNIEEFAPANPEFYIFDAVGPWRRYVQDPNNKINLIGGFARMWVNGKENNSFIYEERG